ncbi:MAG: Flp pilus assembly complex ATPase component TadA [Candidatus Omnitrophica bacterium]|nr:Flp pilus assembly complex ATPase component TadA [Candidatus Omnitrophota bacterium]
MPLEGLEQLLLERNIVEQAQLEKAKAEAEKQKRPLEKALVDLGFVIKDDLYTVVADDMRTIYVDLSTYIPDPKVIEHVPRDLARRFRCFPLFKIKDALVVAMEDPTNLTAMDHLSTHYHDGIIEACLSAGEDIDKAIETSYGSGPSAAEELIKRMGQATLESGTEALDVLEAMEGESPISKLVNLIITQAARDRASDIHIEPEEDILRVRFRIDGILHEIPSPPKHLELAIISRVKVLCNLDIAENRIPQDGHFQMQVDGKRIDFRVSTLPTIHGENVVMRLLDTSSVLIGLEKLGFSKNDLTLYEQVILRPHGVILSTGPTGSGKTTTLYSALTRINSIDRNIITVEDPVEYRLGLIRQVQINPKAGLTFASGLRSIVRQDPDVIMVGEIRDLETAIIAVQSALTGHLVFSTLHTNDAASSITRLENMGVEPFLISASVSAIMAQRLLRKICSACKEPYEPSKAVKKKLGVDENKPLQIYKGAGCSNCKGTGFKGRVGIFELLVFDDEVREMVIQGSSILEIRDYARKNLNMKLLREDGMEKVLSGTTTLEEVSRVTEERVEIKPAAPPEAMVKPITQVKEAAPSEQAPAAKPKTVREADIDDYQKKIAGWLAKRT